MKQKSMQKECIKIMKLRFTLIALTVVTFVSCSRPDSSNIVLGKTVLYYDSINSILDNEIFKYDSFFINRITRDSMIITRYLGGEGYYFHTTFSLKNHLFYENRQIPQSIIEGETETSIIFIPTFMQKDTNFFYTPKDEFIAFFVNDLGFDKCNYQIKKNNNEFITIKQSLTDTTYFEIYYYDKYFNIYKYINTWKDNKCVYMRKE